MSQISDMLASLRPSEVTDQPIGAVTTECATRNRGQAVLEVRSVTNDRGLVPTSDVFESARTSADTSNYKIVEHGMFVYNPSRINVGSIAWQSQPHPVIVSPMYVVFSLDKSQIIPEYLMLFLESRTGKNRIESRIEVGARFRMTYSSLAQIRIPLPPLEAQREIVRVLSQFDQLNHLLRAELTARRAQYAHYRDRLFKFEDVDCEFLTLQEVALDFGRGKSRHRPRNDPSLYDGPYPFIQTGDVRNGDHWITKYSQTYSEAGLSQSKLWPRETVCITIAANIAETGILGFDACFPDSVIGLVVDPKRTSPAYVEYLLQSIKGQLSAKGRGSAQENINLATFENEHFPFPSLPVQEHIVATLDKFGALLTDASAGIPAEISARRSQFDFYCDRLMTFEGSTT